ncbi:MAG TPA: phosphatidate cytidylyltransferase [Candidatus Hydrogenedentes bacterium]|nr:phosphatidate cytidylyltransferase [Candidatus Hydrogenedentota bacterium]
MAAKPSSGVLKRVITGVITLTIFLLAIWMPGLRVVFTGLVTILVFVGLYELFAIARARQISPETIGGMIAGTAIALSGHFENMTLTNFLLYGGCLLCAALHVVRGHYAVAGLAGTIFGVVYVGWFGAHMIMLHGHGEQGPALVTLLIATVALTDTGAFFVGRALGKHKLAPKASPGKTWEGAIGGFAASVLGALAIYGVSRNYPQLHFPEWHVAAYLYAGAVLSVASQFGDLAESVLKRDAGMKDSGNFFPGHGGVLDRCDGFLFAAPFLYYIVLFAE